MITEGFSVRKHQARPVCSHCASRRDLGLSCSSNLFFFTLYTFLHSALPISTLVYYSTLLVFTLPFSTLLCSSLLYPVITDSYLYSIDFCMLFVGHEHTDTGHLQLTKGP